MIFVGLDSGNNPRHFHGSCLFRKIFTDLLVAGTARDEEIMNRLSTFNAHFSHGWSIR